MCTGVRGWGGCTGVMGMQQGYSRQLGPKNPTTQLHFCRSTLKDPPFWQFDSMWGDQHTSYYISRFSLRTSMYVYTHHKLAGLFHWGSHMTPLLSQMSLRWYTLQAHYTTVQYNSAIQ